MRVTINGRFLAAHQTGVQRVARELVRALDFRYAEAGQPTHTRLLVPAGTQNIPLLSAIAVEALGPLHGNLWEQVTLPAAAWSDRLLNLCNMAPLVHRGSVTMIHDTQVLLSPESYSRAFATWYRFAMPRICAQAETVITVSNYSKDNIVRFGLAPAEKVKVVHNGVDHLNDVPPDANAQERFGVAGQAYVVAFGSTQAHKNIEVVLKAFGDDALKALKLILIGADRTALEMAGFQLGQNVIVAGRVPDSQLRGLLEGAVCLAFPSRTEGFGFPPLEAMSAGCPVVAAPCGAVPEVCGDKALYADPDAPGEWIEKLAYLAANPAVRAAMSAVGSRHAAQLTWRRAADTVFDIVQG